MTSSSPSLSPVVISETARVTAREMALAAGGWPTATDERMIQGAIDTECAVRDGRIDALETALAASIADSCRLASAMALPQHTALWNGALVKHTFVVQQSNAVLDKDPSP